MRMSVYIRLAIKQVKVNKNEFVCLCSSNSNPLNHLKLFQSFAMKISSSSNNNKNEMRKIAVITLKNCKFHPEILDIVVDAAYFINSLLHTNTRTKMLHALERGKMKEAAREHGRDKTRKNLLMIFP